MPVISIRVTSPEKKWLSEMAKFNGMSVSKLLKSKSYNQLRNQYDALMGEDRYIDLVKNRQRTYTLYQLDNALDKKTGFNK